MRERLSRALWGIVERHTVALFALLAVTASALVLWQMSRLSEDLVARSSASNAALYTEAIAEFRSLYTSEVVDTARKHGVLVTHDYKDHDGAIPLPATLSLLLAQRMGERHSGAKTRLYSPYPFPWRKGEGGLRDDFERQAWDALTASPDRPFSRVETMQGERVLRYATADRMRARCVDCHNSHPDSPKTDWKEGDTRGILEVMIPLDQVVEESRAGLQRTYFLVGGLILGGLALLAAVLGRLRRTSQEVRARLADLAASEERIRGMNRELEQFNRTLEQRVEARTEEARRHRKSAEDANEAKSLFLANMSHELRTPMNAIIGYSEMLLEETPKGSSASADLQRIHAAGKHLLGLINGILDLSKLEAGKMELYLEDFDVARMAREVVDTVQPLVAKNRNRLEVEIPDGLGNMRADLTRIRQCLFNLIGNACKFTEEGIIRLRIEAYKLGPSEWLRMSISDTGIGMTPDQMANLFQRFSQADISLTRKFGGTGLGLAISRRFCQMLGGDIRVESEAGKGSTFTMELPRRAPEDVPGPVRAAVEGISKGAPRALAGDTVLVVDDDPTAHDIMRRVLEKEGYHVESAFSGEEGLRLARATKPIAITLDVVMPAMDGWAVLAQLKADPALASIPVIMVTMLDNQAMGLSLGVADYLLKPVNRDHLVHVLEKYRTPDAPVEVLVVEDDGATRDLIERLLSRERVTVVTAENGRIGLDRMRDRHPSLIMLDVMMPEMDGYEFLRRLRENPSWQGIPVIVLTAKDLTSADRAMLEGRAQLVVRKDTSDIEQLREKIGEQLRGIRGTAGA